MKNPENKSLKIVDTFDCIKDGRQVSKDAFAIALSNLAVAEATLVKAGKDSAMPHFVAIVKRLESLCGFEFEIIA